MTILNTKQTLQSSNNHDKSEINVKWKTRSTVRLTIGRKYIVLYRAFRYEPFIFGEELIIEGIFSSEIACVIFGGDGGWCLFSIFSFKRRAPNKHRVHKPYLSGRVLSRSEVPVQCMVIYQLSSLQTPQTRLHFGSHFLTGDEVGDTFGSSFSWRQFCYKCFVKFCPY